MHNEREPLLGGTRISPPTKGTARLRLVTTLMCSRHTHRHHTTPDFVCGKGGQEGVLERFNASLCLLLKLPLNCPCQPSRVKGHSAQGALTRLRWRALVIEGPSVWGGQGQKRLRVP
jgi:hypothetical protein